MSKNPHKGELSKLSFAGMLVTLGIIYGDIGTSPLYVMRAIVSGADPITELFILGGLSCVFWTLTLQTTIKYIIITLRADNKGEGGIFALFALIRKRAAWAFIFAIIGGATLLSDSIITPAITIISAIEGTMMVNPRVPIIPIAVVIITVLFFIQRFGTKAIGRSFGPIMFIWFTMLGILGFIQMIRDPGILHAINPKYAFIFLTEFPQGFLLLGAVFLCTTGADALYSDLGHCGLKNIRITWGYAKVCLLLNYFGQGSWVLLNADFINDTTNPFFAIMPEWFIGTGIIIATAAAIIASQAMITGSYTIISEAISLNFWPKIKINYPTNVKGQMYISSINWILYLCCIFVVLFFRKSSNMEAAYGLTINITMLMTTVLLSVYLFQRMYPRILIALLLGVYLTIEGSFLVANLNKFLHGGWFTLLLGGVMFLVMYIWFSGRRLRNKFIEYVKIGDYYEVIQALNKDLTIPKCATNLVFMTKSGKAHEIESKVIYLLLYKQPKRADVYWFVHVEITDEPYTQEYKITPLIPEVLIRIDFRLGFKVQPRVNLFFRQVVEEMAGRKEIDLKSRYESIRKYDVIGDFRFVIIDRVQNYDIDFKGRDQFFLDLYDILRKFSISEVRAMGLDASTVQTETVPMSVQIDSPVPRHPVH